MSSRTNPKETLYFKVPTYLTDLIIHFGVFYLCLFFLDYIPSSFKSIMDGRGVPMILLISYILAISLVGIKLNARRIQYYVVILRAVAQTAITISLYIFMISAIYKSPGAVIGTPYCHRAYNHQVHNHQDKAVRT